MPVPGPPDTSPVGYRMHVLYWNPDAYYPSNETTGTTLFDQHGTPALNLTYNGSMALGQGRAIGPGMWQAHPFYDGSDDYAQGTGPTPGNSMAFLTWIYPHTATQMWIASMGATTPTYTWGVQIDANGKVSFTIWTSAGANYVAAATIDGLVVPRRWTMIGWAHSSAGSLTGGATLLGYVDGVIRAVGTGTSGTRGTGSTMTIGRRVDNAGNKFLGNIQHTAMWNSSFLSDIAFADLHRKGQSYMLRQPNRLRAA